MLMIAVSSYERGCQKIDDWLDRHCASFETAASRVTTYSQCSMGTNVTGIKNMEAQTLNGISVRKVHFQPDVSLDLPISQMRNVRVLALSDIESRSRCAPRNAVWCT